MITPEEVLQNVDWRLLDQQRLLLGEIHCSHRISFNPEDPTEAEALEGILSFLDALTDAAHATQRLPRP
jgi:hypothetical protein